MPVIPIATGVWPKTSVKDVAESLGLGNLSDEAATALSADVEFRLTQLIEPLWGFASTDTLSFRRTTSAVGNLYFVDEEEIDLTKVLAADLPPVPQKTSCTAHWLAVEGIQPAIPQNPTPADLKSHPAFSGLQSLAIPSSSKQAMESQTLTTKEHLSRELRLYFNRRCITDPRINPFQSAFIPGTISTPNTTFDPYLLLSSSFPSASLADELEREIRCTAGSLLKSQLNRYQHSYPTLRTRILKTLTKSLIDPQSTDRNQLGAIIGVKSLGLEATKTVLSQNIKAFGESLDLGLSEGKLDQSRVDNLIKETLVCS
ncbi:hypothetical protein H4Q26_002126 [Puccinia striiformis f. sp. tritici PST-130]|nr:hypothetical protein H4Q26_002126 [Puccinia striiformis f. sp. tritici PST-130]